MTQTETHTEAHTQTQTGQLSTETAREWLSRWDDQQARYFVDREERFEVMVDIVTEVVDRPDPLIVDLGVGPGSLSDRLLRRLPRAQVVGVDMDPLLLGLAQAAYGDSFRTVQADLARAGWLEALDLERAPDAFVSTTALHWLTRDALHALVATAVAALVPGGVFLDGDHFESRPGSRCDGLRRMVAEGARARTGAVPDDTAWSTWWEDVQAAPELAELTARRARTRLTPTAEHEERDRATLPDLLESLRAAGCSDTGVLWQIGDDHVVAGVK